MEKEKEPERLAIKRVDGMTGTSEELNEILTTRNGTGSGTIEILDSDFRLRDRHHRDVGIRVAGSQANGLTFAFENCIFEGTEETYLDLRAVVGISFKFRECVFSGCRVLGLVSMENCYIG